MINIYNINIFLSTLMKDYKSSFPYTIKKIGFIMQILWFIYFQHNIRFYVNFIFQLFWE